MNKPIRAMAVAAMAMFLALLLNVTYLQYFRAEELNARNDNRRARDAEFARQRGAILVAGDPVAISRKSDDRFEYQRRYPEPLMYAHSTGFFSYIYGRSAIEASQNPILSGNDPRLFVDRVIDLLSNTQPEGGSVALTLDEAAQQAAYDGIREGLGEDAQAAVVALEPATGKILAMVSNPTYDPNRLASHDLDEVTSAWDELTSDPDQPMLNRAVGERFPPGSTFKLVTAAAALEAGFEPDSAVKGGARLDLPQTSTDLVNLNGSDCGGDPISLTQALMVSCNVSFGALGLELGAEEMRAQAAAFGFGQRYLTGIGGQALSVFPRDPDPPQLAFSSIGQFEVAASPLQMALVTATIANNGQGMRPYLVDEIRAPDLSVLEKTDPEPMPERAMDSVNAAKLTQMMIEVVDRGTGTTAQIAGIKVAGKTGTAQSAPDRPPYAWFVSFAPADNPQVAVAVMVEDAGVERDQISGSGLAAPIAKRVMEAVINP